MSPPRVEMALGQIGRNSATVQTFLVKNPPSELRHQLPGTSPVISDDCLLNVLVQDEHKKAFYERSIQLRENAVPTLSFDNLKPFQRYSLSSKVLFYDHLNCVYYIHKKYCRWYAVEQIPAIFQRIPLGRQCEKTPVLRKSK